MQITNTVNCNKPKNCIANCINFTNKNNTSSAEKNKNRYKHFEQLSDEALKVRSLLKAHNEVAKSNKMRVYKALPEITTALTGLSLALAQPGKLATKAKAGLGFLALGTVVNGISNFVSPRVDKKFEKKLELAKELDSENNNYSDFYSPSNKNTKKVENKKEVQKFLYTALGTLGATAVAVAGAKKLDKVKMLEPVNKFIKSESAKFAQEINNTKLAKIFENNISPITQKHPKITRAVSNIAPFGVIALGSYSSCKMAQSLEDDFSEKTEFNYKKGKYIQQKAREHFETIDAKEV